MEQLPHPTRSFASDNNAGVHPEILAAVARANQGHVVAYGADPYTSSAIKKFEEHFGADIAVFFTFNGTGANVLGLQALTRSFHSVLCSAYAHIYTDECGAPEKHTGCKLIPLPQQAGKITLESVRHAYHGIGDEHHSQPRVISITQSTEMGTVYRPEEIQEFARFAHEHGMFLHMDGARIANAAVSLGQTLRQASRDLGVDALSFRRYQERNPGRRSGGVLSSRTRPRLSLLAQAGYATGFKNALCRGAIGSSSDQRFVAAQRRTCQPHGSCAGKGNQPHPGSQSCVEGGGERCFRQDPAPLHRNYQGALLLLHVDRGGIDRALDVLLRYY